VFVRIGDFIEKAPARQPISSKRFLIEDGAQENDGHFIFAENCVIESAVGHLAAVTIS
jgi:hypothetical protein